MFLDSVLRKKNVSHDLIEAQYFTNVYKVENTCCVDYDEICFPDLPAVKLLRVFLPHHMETMCYGSILRREHQTHLFS